LVPRRRFLLGSVVWIVVVVATACYPRNTRLQELPVQMGRHRPTPTVPPTPAPAEPHRCRDTGAAVVSYNLDGATASDIRQISGQIKSSCQEAIDVTLNIRWVDGVESIRQPRAFATIARLQPGEVRQFRETATGGRGATRAELSVDVDQVRTRR
jgi:hypothetical protein